MGDTAGRRRLAAIFAADAAGYSRLMAGDEDATLTALDAARAIFKTHIDAQQGRVIDMAGDSVLALFETAGGAVNAALAVQREIEAAAAALAPDRRMRFRIGIHLGDVIAKADGTVYGDGVNIAARLQALAEPGAVAVSGLVQEAVRDHLVAHFQDLGEHEVKNIARPVRVYGVESGARVVATAARRRRWRSVAASGLLLLMLAGGAWVGSADSARDARLALAGLLGKSPAPPSALRASIAVLPFANHSGDAKRDYFSDGITEDVISALGRFSGLLVMSRNAVQAYKGRTPTPAEIGRELGVRYIVHGSVRQADGKLRVVVELSDAERGVQLWSERYEGEDRQVFEIQDRMVRNIVGALAVKLTRIEQQRVFGKPTQSLEAYDLLLRARSLLERIDRGANREARTLLARAQQLAPDFDEVLVALAEAELHRALYGWVEDTEGAMGRAEALCRRVLASADMRNHARANAVLATLYSNTGRVDDALIHAERAVEVNPSDATALRKRGMALLYTGRADEAIAVYEVARRIEPQPHPNDAFSIPFAYFIVGRYGEALATADAMLAQIPSHVGLNAIRAATLAQMGNANEARRAADEVRRLSPGFDVEQMGTRFRNAADTAKVRDGLRKAGL